MDKLQAMATFVRIVEKGSLTAAAAGADASVSSVVRSLGALERHLGVRLLNRTTRRIHLTDEGAQFLERARAILSAVHDSETTLTSRQADPTGRLSVTASVMFGRHYIAPIASDFIRRHPAVTADLLFVDRVVNVIEEGIDVAVRIGPLRDSSLIAVPVGEVRRVICASPHYLRRHGVPRAPKDLAGHAAVRHSGLTPRSEWHFRIGRRDVAMPITPVLNCNEIDSALSACASGLGLGMFLSYQTAPARKSGELKYLLEEFEPAPLPVNVVYPHTKLLSTRVRAFVDECVAKLRQIHFE
ncbi:MAG TPA: LysR family transcriptional regulator [Burkholderiales bacterium]|nr:LysR family transcriptional regulator [Burkholderiales bacterium]